MQKYNETTVIISTDLPGYVSAVKKNVTCVILLADSGYYFPFLRFKKIA
jgi:hypothetical protein